MILRTVWPNLVKFRHLGNIVKLFGKFYCSFSTYGIILYLLWQKIEAFGQIFFIDDGQYWKIIQPSGHTEELLLFSPLRVVECIHCNSVATCDEHLQKIRILSIFCNAYNHPLHFLSWLRIVWTSLNLLVSRSANEVKHDFGTKMSLHLTKEHQTNLSSSLIL